MLSILTPGFIKYYNQFVNAVSFNEELKKFRRDINMSIDVPEIIEEFPDSHPRGFIREFRRRRTTIAETYLRITKTLDSANYSERLHALKLLAEHVIYSKSLKMPLNAARVQLALMKEVVKNRENKRQQLELLRDFSASTFGHPRVIREYLKKLNIVEVPETGKQLKDLNMGFDFHVHDKASYGRKSAVQLLIDAFIKGISELTVAYNKLNNEESMREVIEAGHILGIKVNIAIEFSAKLAGNRFHFQYVLPHFHASHKKLKKILHLKTEEYSAFINELAHNEKNQKLNIIYLVQLFNQKFLPEINKGYQPGTIYFLAPLSAVDPQNPDKLIIKSKRHLGELLYPKLKEVVRNRALFALAMKKKLDNEQRFVSEEERKFTNEQFEHLHQWYKKLSPEYLRLTYFNSTENILPETIVSSLVEICKFADKTKGRIKLIEPLEHGLDAAIDAILESYNHVTHVEIFNMFASTYTPDEDFEKLTEFLKILQTKDSAAVFRFYEKYGIKCGKKRTKSTEEVCTLANKVLIPTLGSDATGWSTMVPGMGFVWEHRIPKHQRRWYVKRHLSLSSQISGFLAQQGDHVVSDLPPKMSPNLLSMGSIDISENNLTGRTEHTRPIPISNAFKYLNPNITHFILILIGLIPAYYILGIEYALLWFAITGTRNIFVDLISSQGIVPGGWSEKDINWTNLANSLFWTGFSVPILGFVKAQFDHVYPWVHHGAMYEYSKFFFINIANGTYLATHNYIRGFDKGTIRGNFFRSILAWPFSATFSPLGDMLGIPSIVQAKFWSDFMAAIIEGSAKYKNSVKLQNGLVDSILADFDSDDEEVEILAVLDLMYITQGNAWATRALTERIHGSVSWKTKLKALIFRNKLQKATPQKFNVENLQYWFKSADSYQRLCDYVIKNYRNEQSLLLIEMITRNYHRLKKFAGVR